MATEVDKCNKKLYVVCEHATSEQIYWHSSPSSQDQALQLKSQPHLALQCNLELHFLQLVFFFSDSVTVWCAENFPASFLVSRNPREVLACIIVSQGYALTPSLSVTPFPLKFLFSKLFKTTPNKSDAIGICLSRPKLEYLLNSIWGMSGRKNHYSGPSKRGYTTICLICHFPSFQHRS